MLGSLIRRFLGLLGRGLRRSAVVGPTLHVDGLVARQHGATELAVADDRGGVDALLGADRGDELDGPIEIEHSAQWLHGDAGDGPVDRRRVSGAARAAGLGHGAGAVAEQRATARILAEVLD